MYGKKLAVIGSNKFYGVIVLDKLKLDKLRAIVDFMNESGWDNVACDMSRFDREFGQLLSDVQYDGFIASPIKKLFIELAVISVSIAEIKYEGYCELLKNADNHASLDSIAHKHTEAMQLRIADRNKIVSGISEAIALLQDLQEKIMQLGDIGQYAES